MAFVLLLMWVAFGGLEEILLELSADAFTTQRPNNKMYASFILGCVFLQTMVVDLFIYSCKTNGKKRAIRNIHGLK